jgi:hypothetical protein
MRQDDTRQRGEDLNRVRRRSWVLVALCAGLAILFIALFVPVLDVNKRQRGNESATVSRLRRLNELQNRHAASSPAKGFACQSAQLKPSTTAGETYDPNEFLLSGAQSGYKFAITGCGTDSNGVVTRYQVTAVPIEPAKSGFRAFCTDQTGAIWYDSKGSAENCLASRRPLQ